MKKELTFEKTSLGAIEKCYAVLGMVAEGEPCLLYGGEGNGSLQAFQGKNLDRCDLLWEGGGGTMSIVPLPGQEGWALASRGFYSMVDCGDSTIELIRWQNGAFTHQPVATLPFLHRFDTLLGPDGTRYLFAASLHSGKADKEDWSTPGHLFFGPLPENVEASFQVELSRLPGDFFMNHGFYKGQWEGREAAFTASREGVFVWLPPEAAGGAWRMEQLLGMPTSDVAVLDIDGDGEMEIAALLPFHGDQCKVFRRVEGVYQEVFACPGANDFYHALVGGQLGGERVFACGARKLDAELFLVRWDPESGAFFTQTLEKGSGPSNLSLLHWEGEDWLLSANRMVFEAAVYRFS